MTLPEEVGKLTQQIHIVDNVCITARILGFKHHIGQHASAIVDLTTGAGRELVNQRVGHGVCRTALIARGVVDSLNTATAGEVVFSGCNLDKSVVSRR